MGTLSRDSQPDPFFAYLDELQQANYPYDMVQIRYSIGGRQRAPGPGVVGVCQGVERTLRVAANGHLDHQPADA